MASAGVILGHWLAYLLAVPQAEERAQVLAASGHGYWLIAVKLAVVLGLASLGAVVAGRLSARLHGEAAPRESLLGLAVPLAATQVVAFAAMEVVERLLAGVSVAGMFQNHVVFFGIAVQVVLALAGALVLLGFGRGAARVIAVVLAARSFPRPASWGVRFALVTASAPDAESGSAGLRGPPRS